ncbi:helix-turn-helix transcriptional regulator [Methylobacterium sp. WL64]|uniref:helix-turn-helix domain-containing protein n=1 Tax=Methylobacterium sp. WL64 TaxID=2603894 RepID=UPI0011CB892C|nr:helix-turn-helix transcriptional regulator [Methylobacterium sp. WL64]TXN03829.1 helix-turn-helix transcriptional regulator [Methylobacterium sp. WL64]
MRKTLHTSEHAHMVALLKQERHRVGLTQQEVAHRLGAPQSFVAKYEGGERRLDLIEFLAIARAVEADPIALFARMLEGFDAQP